jgi:IS605 OrfB family transposase
VVSQSFRSFLALLGLKKRGKYVPVVKIPQYLNKDGYFLAIFPQDMFTIQNDHIRLSLGRYFSKEHGIRYLYFALPPNVQGCQVQQVRILPIYNAAYMEIEYIYKVNPMDPTVFGLDKTKYLGIDLGLNNFATCASTIGTAFILEGSGIKSYNRWYNKVQAKLQSVYDKQGNKFGRKRRKLLFKRKHKMRNFMAQQANYIIKYCLKERIGNIVVGDWEDMKRGLPMQKKQGQHFQQLPYKLFKDKLETKSKQYGITYVLHEESYTSQDCVGCGIRRKQNRIYRGLYRCQICLLEINADVNGALNIIKKVAPKAVKISKFSTRGSSGGMISPVRIRVLRV